ncbi:hypothetical protein [uncultured Polaribacter sp.]|uniref:hypothetical protein n=1 Tax=uncultured Polaribacter sp. TaxID=174711 RepID=UPI0026288021|nr:hypothetical protein [uncultured Polaribacter sp.]
MKNITLLLLFTFFFSYSQENNNYEIDSEPNSKNELSLYFKKKIPIHLLKSVTYPKNYSALEISFFVNKDTIPFNIQVNSGRNTKLNESLIEAFENYSLKRFNIKFDTRKKYSFQVITKDNYTNVINCSNSLTEITSPNCESCLDLDFYTDIKSCITDKLKKYFYKSIDYNIKIKENDNKRVTLNIKLFIDQNGFLKIKKNDVPIEFQEHIKNIVDKFPEIFTPKSVNNNSVSFDYSFFQSFTTGEAPKTEKIFRNFDSIFKPSTDNNFTKYLSKNLTEEEINKANLNRINERLSIYFELNKNGNPFQITTNSRSKKLEKKIISLFKNYELNNFTFINKKDLNRYFTSVIIFENNKNIIKTNDIMGYKRAPILPNCKKSKTTKDARKCFSKQVQLYFVKKFNSKLPNKLGLSPGRKRIFIGFKINKKGKITELKVRAPHIKIKEEVIRVMKKLPKSSPAIFGNKPVNIKYSIPFTLIVE